MQKAKGNLLEICAQARKIFGVTDIGNDNHQALKVNPEVRTRVALESESDSESNSESESDSESNSSNSSESEGESNADHGLGVHEDRGEDNREVDRNSNIDYHCDNNDADDGNGHDDSGPSRSEIDSEVVDSLECYIHHGVDAEKNDRDEENEEVVDPGPSRRRGRRDTKSWI
jgi:clumping factor B